MTSKIVFICALIWAAVLVDLAASKCNPRDYSKGSVVCVCSEKEKCVGDFAHLKVNPDKKTITSYRTTKAGERFEHSEYVFAAEAKPAGSELLVKVSLNPEKTYQKIYGFGGAFTDATGYNIVKLSKDLQNRLVRDYFAHEGIGYRMGRIPIGGSDFSTRGYSYDDNPDDESLAKFALQAEDFAYKLPFLRQAIELTNNSITLFGSAWASPAWMKTNKELNHGGVLIGEPGGKYYKLFAKYLAKFFEEYEKQSVPVWGLTVINEPHFGFQKTYPFNVLGFTPETQRDFVKLDLGPELDKLPGAEKKKIMIFDDNVPQLHNFTTTVLSDKDANKYVAGLAFHWYDNRINPRGDILDAFHAQNPDKFMLSTEACEVIGAGDGKTFVVLGNWKTFENYSYDIISDLNHHTNGWIDWNMALDTQGGPNWVNNFVDAPIIVNASAQEYYKQPSFYALGHFAKFLVPNSVRIDQNVTNADDDIQITVFERPDKTKVATVFNRKDSPFQLQLHDPVSGFATVEIKPNSLQSLIFH